MSTNKSNVPSEALFCKKENAPNLCSLGLNSNSFVRSFESFSPVSAESFLGLDLRMVGGER